MAPFRNPQKSRKPHDGSLTYLGKRSTVSSGMAPTNTTTKFVLVLIASIAVFIFMMFSLLNDSTSSEILVVQESLRANPMATKIPDLLRSTMPRELYADIEARHAARIKRIKQVCQENSKELRMLYTWKYKFDQKHNLLYCPIPKSGWSSWKRVLFYINGVITSMDVEIGITPDRKARVADMSGFAIPRANKTGQFRPFTFVFVRNPWERLVSAYINKALDWNYTRILHSPCEWETMIPFRPPITFQQFISCIVNVAKAKKRLDMHWIPMWTLCDFCQINYNAVGHIETVSTDAKYVIERLALNIEFPRIFSSRAHNTSDVLHSWYASLPLDLIQELRKLYKYDFLMHGYSDIPPGWENKLA